MKSLFEYQVTNFVLNKYKVSAEGDVLESLRRFSAHEVFDCFYL